MSRRDRSSALVPPCSWAGAAAAAPAPLPLLANQPQAAPPVDQDGLPVGSPPANRHVPLGGVRASLSMSCAVAPGCTPFCSFRYAGDAPVSWAKVVGHCPLWSA